MYEPNIEKTSFVVDRGTYSYHVMLFELKNTGATIKSWLIESSKIKLNEQYRYISILVKSKKKKDYLIHLRESFNQLRKYNMKLNLKKSTFSVASRKFLGNLVNKRGIEANPD